MGGGVVQVLVTGGAGFIGRWVVKRLLELGHQVLVLDNLSSGSEDNLDEFRREPGLCLEVGDIKDHAKVDKVFACRPQLCVHLAASINVQDSLDNPRGTFANDVLGTFNVLEACRRDGVRFAYMSTCMVYAACQPGGSIGENHVVQPASPYAGAKLAGEHLALSYYHGYGLPVVVLRPFNTYGPYQKTGGEGGVIAVFLSRALRGHPLQIYGDGAQTRDFLYAEDCADFVVSAALAEATAGRVINAGSGRDFSINQLAGLVVELTGQMIPGVKVLVSHVPHIHPQSEISKLRCDFGVARELLGWQPTVTLDEGLRRTAAWIGKQLGLPG